MMVSFDFLSHPIDLSNGKINVLYIENHFLFRKTVSSFFAGCPDESNIVFSKDFAPVQFKGNVCFVPDIFNLDFSSAFMKKVYEDLSVYANTYISEELAAVKADVLSFLDRLSQDYDYDFSYNEEFDITALLKMQSFKPDLSADDLLSSLLDFLILTQKYSKSTCFVILNFHTAFAASELEGFYKELAYQNIQLLALENKKSFASSPQEKIYIVDSDMCEISEG